MGANAQKGEASISVGQRDYTLAFNINAMCEVEYILNLSTDQILRALASSPPLNVVRALLWGGLRQHHADVDLIGAGNLIEEMGGPGLALDGIGKALVSAFPDAKDEPANPRKGAAAGTGRRSFKLGSQ
jgi:hypothetical protein